MTRLDKCFPRYPSAYCGYKTVCAVLLSQDDLQRVDDVRTALTNYRKVDNEEFVKLGEEAKPVK